MEDATLKDEYYIKSISMNNEFEKMVDEHRWANRIESFSEALRALALKGHEAVQQEKAQQTQEVC